MKAIITTTTLTLFASAVVAQDLGALPACAKSCLAGFTTGGSIGNCKAFDAKCICANESFLSGIACCLADACDAADQKGAVDFALSFCSTQGVTDLPTSVTCATASAASTTSGPTQASTQQSSSSSSQSQNPSSATEPTTTATTTQEPTSSSSPSPSPSAGAIAGVTVAGGHIAGGLLAAAAALALL